MWEMVSLTFFTAGSLFWKKVLLITRMGYCPTTTVGAWFHRASHRKWDPAAELIVAIPDNVCDAEKHAKGCLGGCSLQCFAWNTWLLLHWQRACFNRQSWPNWVENEMQMQPIAQTKWPFGMCNCLSQPNLRQMDKETINFGEHPALYPRNEHKTSEILPTQQTLTKSVKCPRKGVWEKKALVG